MYIQQIMYFAIHLKLKQPCKLTIFQLKKSFEKE